jgi:hypothetical protein
MTAKAPRPFRHLSTSIASKRNFLTVNMTVILARPEAMSSAFKYLEVPATIEWSEGSPSNFCHGSQPMGNPGNDRETGKNSGPRSRLDRWKGQGISAVTRDSTRSKSLEHRYFGVWVVAWHSNIECARRRQTSPVNVTSNEVA